MFLLPILCSVPIPKLTKCSCRLPLTLLYYFNKYYNINYYTIVITIILINKYLRTQEKKTKRTHTNQLIHHPWELNSDDYAFSMQGKGLITIQCQVGGVNLECIVDSGASANIIDDSTWETLKAQSIKCNVIKQMHFTVFKYIIAQSTLCHTASTLYKQITTIIYTNSKADKQRK